MRPYSKIAAIGFHHPKEQFVNVVRAKNMRLGTLSENSLCGVLGRNTF